MFFSRITAQGEAPPKRTLGELEDIVARRPERTPRDLMLTLNSYVATRREILAALLTLQEAG